ncbi:MAG: hypothetical protein AAFR44_11345 [Pseudomonadota bacterium]
MRLSAPVLPLNAQNRLDPAADDSVAQPERLWQRRARNALVFAASLAVWVLLIWLISAWLG